MKKNSLNVFYTIIGFIAFLLIGWGIFELAKYIINIFPKLSNDVAASIIAAVSTVLISVGSVVATKIFEKRREIRKQHREKKIPVYEELISFMLKVFLSENAGQEKPSQDEIIKFLMEFTEKIIVWGSDEVLMSFRVFREELIRVPQKSGENPHMEAMFCLEDLMLEIRKDLGHDNRDFEKGDVLSLFISDIKEYV